MQNRKDVFSVLSWREWSHLLSQFLLTLYYGGVFVCFSDGGGGNCPADFGVQPAPVMWETCCPRQSPVRPAGVRMVTHQDHHFSCLTSWGQDGVTRRPPQCAGSLQSMSLSFASIYQRMVAHLKMTAVDKESSCLVFVSANGSMCQVICMQCARNLHISFLYQNGSRYVKNCSVLRIVMSHFCIRKWEQLYLKMTAVY